MVSLKSWVGKISGISLALFCLIFFADVSFGEKSSIYSPMGKRDPFRQPLTDSSRETSTANPLEKWAVERLELKAILKGIGRPRAMFEDPDGKTFIVSEGDILGRERGTISRILNKEVIITERTFNYLGAESLYERVLSLPNDEDSSGKSAAGTKSAIDMPTTVPEPVIRKTTAKAGSDGFREASSDNGGGQRPMPMGPAGLNVNSSNLK